MASVGVARDHVVGSHTSRSWAVQGGGSEPHAAIGSAGRRLRVARSHGQCREAAQRCARPRQRRRKSASAARGRGYISRARSNGFGPIRQFGSGFCICPGFAVWMKRHRFSYQSSKQLRAQTPLDFSVRDWALFMLSVHSNRNTLRPALVRSGPLW